MVDLDAIEALYENVSVLSIIHICMLIRCEETTILCHAIEVFILAAYILIGMENCVEKLGLVVKEIAL